MRKLLYIGPNISSIKSGADSVNKRNMQLLKEIFGDDFLSYVIENDSNTLKDKLSGFMGGLSKNDENKILNLIKKYNVSYVFLSQSIYGRLCRSIKKKFKEVKILMFFHNIEKHYAQEFIRVNGLFKLPFYFLVSYNEKVGVKFSDYNIVLNNRDSSKLNYFYGKTADLVLPVSYLDVFDVSKVVKSLNKPPVLLFVGTDFFANVDGINKFVEFVMPYVDAKLIIVGKGMEKYKSKWEINNNIQVFGFVDDLSELYYSSSAVVAPIFSGGGMKTKIAEALMYGKIIIGTSEAFEGYEINNQSLFVCDSLENFISCINSLENVLTNFSSHSRSVFENYYDNRKIASNLKDFIEGL